MSKDHDNDLYDSPIIFADNKYYTYAPLWIDFDAIYTISNIMRRCEDNLSIFSKIGKNYEQEINDMLKKRGFQTRVNQTYKGQEIDILAKDSKNKESVFIECKTFTPPTSIKDYAIQVEKIISNMHIPKARKNFDCLKQSADVQEFIQDTHVKEMYVPNIVIPSFYKKYLNINNILYVQYFTLTKLLTTPSEYLNKEFNNSIVICHRSEIEYPIPIATLNRKFRVNLDSNNLLGKNLITLNDKQPKLKVCHVTKRMKVTRKKQCTEYVWQYFKARELDCGFIKMRFLL